MDKAPEALQRMLQRYDLASLADQKNAIKEIVQEIALLGLWRAKFFEKAAFYGGTALRILHQLDRFSEDLDFTLLKPDQNFDLGRYENAIEEELQSLGFHTSVEKKRKTKQSAIDSAFIKFNTIEHLLLIGISEGLYKDVHPEEVMKIRLEVDTDPPSDDAVTENILLLLPSPFSVKTLRIEDLFAGKLHAVLCREWKGRVKGRDWYDLIWFVAREIPANLHYLEQRMRQSGYWEGERPLSYQELQELLKQKIENLDISSAKEDMAYFLKDPSQLDLWSKKFFFQIATRIRIL
ncbi:MAG: hypothetical protein K940chlam9_00846 [Chlamydiae bacterium]|nr:hypothetical protein [Chlamydiota bacterium]